MKYIWLALILIILNSQFANAQSGLFIAPSTSVFTSPLTGQSWLFNSTSRTIEVYNGATYTTVNYPFSNLSASTNPTSSNDNTQGYVIGSFWINQTTQTLYMATSVATSSAVWVGMNVVTSTIPLANIQQGGATDGQSLVWNNGAGVWNPANPLIGLSQLTQSGATNNQVITWNNGDSAWEPANAGSGTVTDVTTGNLSPLFTASFANPTTTPLLSFSLSACASHGILSNATSGSHVPAYNVLSLTAGTGLTGGGDLATSPTVSLSTPVSVANGGSGASTFTQYGVLIGEGTSPFDVTAAGTNGYPLIANTSADPTFQQLNLTVGVTNVLPLANGGTGEADAADAITNLIGGSPSSGQALEWNGSNWVPATVSGTGTVTTFSSGNASPLFSTSVANPTSTPALSFTVSNAATHTILSNTTSGSTTPSYNNLTITAGTGLTGGGSLATSPTISLSTPVSNSNLGSTVVTSVGNLSPLFTTTVASQTLGFALSSVGAHYYFGNSTGSSGAPGFQAIAASDLPSTTVNTTGNLSPLFTSSISGQALSFSLTNAAGHGILSNTSGSPGGPAYNVLSLTAGTGLTITNSGVLATSPTVALSTPVSVANGGTGTALFTHGTATFITAGSVAVSDSTITSSSIIVVTEAGNGSALAESFDVEVSAGSGFTIYSTNVASTAIVNWIRIN